MPKYQPDDEQSKNSKYRSARRQSQRRRRTPATAGRQLTVHSEKRVQPDIRKIARAVLALAMAEAERERQAETDAPAGDEDA